jgi:hypothetical protein
LIAPTGVNDQEGGRDGHSATLLLDGRVLMAGGGVIRTSAELYDPGSGR